MTLLSLAITMQAMSASPPERVDLTIPQPCATTTAADGEVVVCANRNGESPYRLKEPVASSEASEIPKAKVKVAEGMTAAAEIENVNVGGFPSNRIMLGLKIKF